MAPKKNPAKPKQTKAAPEQDVRLAWDNMDEVMEKFDLTYPECKAALTEILGPDPMDRVANRYL